MPLRNPWIRYVDRTYQQIKDRVLTQLGVLVPEMTDHSESNPFVKILSIYAGITEMLNYYIDNVAREAHLSVARLYRNMVLHAEAYDYQIHSKTATSVDVVFTMSGTALTNYIIPINTELASDGIVFYTTAEVTILAGSTTATVSAKQFEFVAESVLGLSVGGLNQIYAINPDIVDSSAIVRVAGIAWNRKETLAYSKATSTDFVQSVNMLGVPIIKFGDNFNGQAPTGGAEITIEHLVTTGQNIEAEALTTIVTSLSPPDALQIAVINLERSSGGNAAVETLEQMRNRIPKLVRTQQRAVTGQNYIDVCELKPGVQKAGLVFNCGKTVNLFIVPDGGGLASEILRQETVAYMNLFKMVTTEILVFSAGEVRIIYGIDLVVLPQYTRSVVVAAVKQKLLEFHAAENQSINGQVQLSDIYESIETTDGVSFSQINKMTPKPYARPLNETTPLLNWTRDILPASSTVVSWKILFIAVSTFEVYKNNNFVGIFAVGALVSQTEISFTINQNYVINDSWEFFSYRFFGSISLVEPSLPTTSLDDIVINATGGL